MIVILVLRYCNKLSVVCIKLDIHICSPCRIEEDHGEGGGGGFIFSISY